MVLAHSWDFGLTVLNPSYTSPASGVIISYNHYNMSTNASEAVNYISPTDILIGLGVESGANLTWADTYTYDNAVAYNMSFAWGDREVTIKFDALPVDQPVILSSIENFHCIARTATVLSDLENVTIGASIQLSGYIVNVRGNNDTYTLNWTTDYYAERAANGTIFGSTHCDIMVISSLGQVSATSTDFLTLEIALIVIVVVCAGVIIVYISKKNRGCSCPNITIIR